MKRIVLERRPESTPNTPPKIVEAPRPPVVRLDNAAVVLTVHARPEVVRECLRAFHAYTHPDVRLVVLDDASDAATMRTLEYELKPISRAWDGRVMILRNDKNAGYIDSVNRGIHAAFGEPSVLSIRPRVEWAVCLNADTKVTPGWLEHMISVGEEDERIGVVCPWLSDGGALTLRMPPGASYLETAARVAAVSPEACPASIDAVTPVGACMAVRRSWWERLGEFDKDAGRVYGEEDRWWVKLLRAGGLAKVATRAWVWHWGQGVMGPGAEAARQASIRAFEDQHGDFLRPRQAEAARVDPRLKRGVGIVPRMASARTNTRPRLYFWFQSARHCGGVLVMRYLCDHLCDLGIEATIVFRDDHFEEWRIVGEGAKFAPIFLQSQDPGDWLAAGGSEEGIVVASSWFDGTPVKALCERFPGLRPRVFIQSADDLTLDMHGVRRWPEEMIADYLEIAAEHGGVCNARWIIRSIEERRGVSLSKLDLIPCGVDTDLFRPDPGPRRWPFRVLAMHRYKSPERGPDVLRDVIGRLLEQRPGIEVATYGNERMEGVPTTWLGVLTQRQVAEEMRRSHVLLDTSVKYGHSFGLPALEMMASGGVVVSTDNLGIEEFASWEHDCILASDPAELSAAIMRVHDDAARMRDHLGHEARRTALRYQWDSVAAAWADWYRWQSEAP